jgi:hypothetical protein
MVGNLLASPPYCKLKRSGKNFELLSEEYDLSEDDNSPTYSLGRDERNLSTSHEEIHRCIVRLLELQ